MKTLVLWPSLSTSPVHRGRGAPRTPAGAQGGTLRSQELPSAREDLRVSASRTSPSLPYTHPALACLPVHALSRVPVWARAPGHSALSTVPGE